MCFSKVEWYIADIKALLDSRWVHWSITITFCMSWNRSWTSRAIFWAGSNRPLAVAAFLSSISRPSSQFNQLWFLCVLTWVGKICFGCWFFDSDRNRISTVLTSMTCWSTTTASLNNSSFTNSAKQAGATASRQSIAWFKQIKTACLHGRSVFWNSKHVHVLLSRHTT